MLKYPYRKRNGNPVFLQIKHGLPHILLLFHLKRNLSCLPLTDAFDLSKPLRLLLNNPKSIFFKLLHNLTRKGSSHSLDCTGTKIPFHRHQILRLTYLRRLYLKLRPIQLMSRIFACQLQKSAFFYIMKLSYASKVSVVIIQIKYRISVFFITVYNMLHISLNRLHVPIALLLVHTCKFYKLSRTNRNHLSWIIRRHRINTRTLLNHFF